MILEKDNTTVEESLEKTEIDKDMENDKSDLSIDSNLSLEEIDDTLEENSTLNSTEGDLIENLHNDLIVYYYHFMETVGYLLYNKF